MPPQDVLDIGKSQGDPDEASKLQRIRDRQARESQKTHRKPNKPPGMFTQGVNKKPPSSGQGESIKKRGIELNIPLGPPGAPRPPGPPGSPISRPGESSGNLVSSTPETSVEKLAGPTTGRPAKRKRKLPTRKLRTHNQHRGGNIPKQIEDQIKRSIERGGVLTLWKNIGVV